MERIRKRRRRMIRLAGLAVLALAVPAVLFLFQVRSVTVVGNVRRSSEEIASDLSHDFLTGNTLYLTWKYRGDDVPENMSYLSSMEIHMDSPSRITVAVTERELVAYLDRDQNIYFDEDGVVLEISDEVYGDIPVVTGVSAGEATLYQRLPTNSSAQLRTILSLVRLLSYQELSADEIRFSDNMDITVTIGGVEAELGQDEYLEEKIANLRAILDALGDKSGTLHMESFTGKNESVTFAEDGAPQTEAESETEDGSAAGEDTGAAESEAAAGEGDGTSGSGDAAAEEGDGTPEDGAAGAAESGAAAAGDQTQEAGAAESGALAGDQGQEDGAADTGEEPEDSGSATFMVFNSAGSLISDARVVNGVVVDSAGNPIDGCSINEDGNVVDAYWNVIDPSTGQLAQ